jgi:hypothetical protein
MYNAAETLADDMHHGTTKLHMDLTDALNKMLWAAKSRDGKPGCALWHIFSATDVFLLRKFFIEDCGFTGPGDPVHSQMVYVNPDMRKRLRVKYGIRPHTVYQYPGDVVFIPAYCPHQVSHLLCVAVLF